MHLTASRFWKSFNTLPENIRNLATKNFELLKINSYHPSLHFKKIGKFWSVRIGDYYRLWQLKTEKITYGFGSAIMMNMKIWLKSLLNNEKIFSG